MRLFHAGAGGGVLLAARAVRTVRQGRPPRGDLRRLYQEPRGDLGRIVRARKVEDRRIREYVRPQFKGVGGEYSR